MRSSNRARDAERSTSTSFKRAGPNPSVHTYDLTWSVRVLNSVPFASTWRDRGEKKEFGADHVLCLTDPVSLQRTISIGDVASDTTDRGPTT